MKSLAVDVEVHKNQLVSNAPFVFLLEVETKDDPPQRIRLCQFDKVFHFGVDGEGAPIKYSPAPMNVGSVTSNSSGDLPTLDVTIALSGPIDFLKVDENDGYVDQPARVLLVSSLNTSAAVIDEEAKIIESEFGYESIRFSITGSDLFQAKFPHLVYSRTSCPYTFGGKLCQYSIGAADAGYGGCGVTTTGNVVAQPFSLEACTLVGDDEAARLLPRNHPKFWGGERGIPRG